MKRHSLFIYLLWFFAFFFAANALNALTIPASEDSYTAPGNKLSAITDAGNSLMVDATRKSYLYFDLSDIPADAVVRWAKLRLFLPTVRTAGAGLSVHLVTGTWNESTRQNTHLMIGQSTGLRDVPSISNGTIGVISPSKMASRRFVTVDVTDTVQQWINGGTLNEGFAVQAIVQAGSQTASVMLTSKEGPVFGLPAELDIEFQPEGGVEKPVTLDQLPSEMRALLNPRPIAVDQLPLSVRTLLSPAIVSQPVNPASYWSGLSVQAQGLGNLSYQWMRNGIAVSGGTGANLAVDSLQSGTYTVAVSNGFATVVSEGVQFSEPQFTDLFALVTGGTLPASSELGAVPVKTFYIGNTEVTWGEWQGVRTWAVANGYTDLDGVGAGVGANYPVTHVNWHDVVKWCNARSEKEGKVPVYKNGAAVYRTGEVSDPAVVVSANGYRLPTEAEWEFAARGGTQTNGYTYSGSNDLDAVGWYAQNSGNAVHEVGKKLANELGIYDMSGNLWEWSGSWHPNHAGLYRVSRGGYWSVEELCTVAYRNYSNPEHRYFDGGFRVATSGEYALGITAQPSVSADGSNISVQAEGAGTLTYQWKRNGGAIAGGTSSQLSTQGLQSGTYTVVVSNGFASVTSGSLTLNVAATLYVSKNGSDSTGNGLQEAPFATLQKAIDAANDGTTVLVLPGTYTGVGNQDVNLRGKKIAVRSTQGAYLTVLDLGGKQAFLAHGTENADTVVDGFTVINGYCSSGADWGGKGIVDIRGAGLSVRNCVFRNNEAVVTYLTTSAAIVFQTGGGQTLCKVDNCIFFQNTVRGGKWGTIGLARMISGDLIEVTRCTITSNTLNSNGTVGGGVISTNGNIDNVIVWNNGPAVPSAIVAPRLSYSICDGVVSNHNWLALTGTAITGTINADPLFTNASNGDFSLTIGSPAKDAGNPTTAVDTDGSRADIGVYGVMIKSTAVNEPTISANFIKWGTNSAEGRLSVPSNLSDVVTIDAGFNHSVALKTDGSVVAWGGNGGAEKIATVPSSLQSVVEIDCGWAWTLTRRADGSLFAWGANDSGQISSLPTGTGFVQISAGNMHGAALRSNGTIVCWGRNDMGQCNIPAGLSAVKKVIAYGHHTLVLCTDGSVRSWGVNFPSFSLTPVPSNLGVVKDIAAGGGFCMALKSDGTVVAWGDNSLGQTTVPAGLSNVAKIFAMASTAFAIKTNGEVVSWGDNSGGQRTIPSLPAGTTITEIRGDSAHAFGMVTTSPPGIVIVTGGTLPASSQLGAVSVNTFYIGKTEVTWGEWTAVRTWAAANGYTDLANVGQGVGDNYPVTHVSWYDVVKWCNARSEKEGKTPVYTNGGSVYRTGVVSGPQVNSSANGYRLPSSKEWEFAGRGGTQTSGYIYSGGNGMEEVGWYSSNAAGAVHEVGKKRANELGIHDMSGNVMEWTGDQGGVVSQRIFRGGSWFHGTEEGKLSQYYTFGDAANGNNHFGFRVALSAAP